MFTPSNQNNMLFVPPSVILGIIMLCCLIQFRQNNISTLPGFTQSGKNITAPAKRSTAQSLLFVCTHLQRILAPHLVPISSEARKCICNALCWCFIGPLGVSVFTPRWTRHVAHPCGFVGSVWHSGDGLLDNHVTVHSHTHTHTLQTHPMGLTLMDSTQTETIALKDKCWQ